MSKHIFLKNQKNIIDFSSAEFAHGVVKVIALSVAILSVTFLGKLTGNKICHIFLIFANENKV